MSAVGGHVSERAAQPSVEAAFAGFYQRERDGLVRAVSLAVGDPALATEAVDEAMARAWQRWRTVSQHARPAGWVYRVAVNWARSVWRRLRRTHPTDTPPDGGVAPPAPRDTELWAALEQLPSAQRDAIVLHHVLQWTNPEIAEALDVPVGTVKARTSRGLARLREEVSR